MKFSHRPVLSALVLGLAGFTMTHGAQAGCGYASAVLKPSGWDTQTELSPKLRAAFYQPPSAGKFLLVDDDNGWSDQSGIVGMWRFILTTPGPNNTTVVVDDGYAQWHSDGTEIQNSGLHAPMTSNFCLGVWKQVAHNSYKLNHFPLAWDQNGQTPYAAIQLTENVWLTDENHLAGTFVLKVYPWTTTNSLTVAGPPVGTVTGTVTAVRVTLDSTVPGAQ